MLHTEYFVMNRIIPTRFAVLPQLAAPNLVSNSKWYYTDFMKALDSRTIDSVVLHKHKDLLHAETKDGRSGIVVLPSNGLNLVDVLVSNDVRVRFDDDQVFDTIDQKYTDIAIYVVIGLAFLGVLKIMSKNSQPSFAKNNAKYEKIPDTCVSFADVAGVDNAVEELRELVEFLKTPKKYEKLGATIPKGCLLVGSPGCGKTLLARAVAGEANVPFFSCSGSSFMEMYVGVGASRIRDLFTEAKNKSPCIVFIDEIDSVGRARSTNPHGGESERDQTINQLLTEMDGYEPTVGVIVMAATNRIDILDEALLRPGRFDRQIEVEPSDYKGRIEILKIHSRNKPIDDSLDMQTIARATTGFSGAELANLTNEAAISAARHSQEYITGTNFEEALDKLSLGAVRATAHVSDDKKRVLAYHEAGHALAALKVGDYDPIRKVTILPRSKSGGATMFDPSIERMDIGLISKSYLQSQLVVALGGRVAEEIAFGEGEETTGSSNDLVVATNIARSMIEKYGMSDKFGIISLEHGYYSEQTSYEIDQEVMAILDDAYIKTRYLLETNVKTLDKLAKRLLVSETLSGDQVRKICGKSWFS